MPSADRAEPSEAEVTGRNQVTTSCQQLTSRTGTHQYERAPGGSSAWREYFCLVNPDAGMEDDPEAASAVTHKHLEAAFAQSGDDSVENFAMSLKDAGYVNERARTDASEPGCRISAV